MNVDPSNVVSWYNVGVGIAAVISGVFAYFWGRKHEAAKAEKDDIVDASITPLFQQKQNIVAEHLMSLRILGGADRAKIGQFHNGGKFLDGSPMKRFTVTHEVCDIGVPFEATGLQNIVVTILWDLIVLVKQDKASITFTKDIPVGHFRSYCKSHGIDAVAVLPLRKDELFTGFVMVEWCDVDRIPEDMTAFMDTMEEHRSAIEVEMLLGK